MLQNLRANWKTTSAGLTIIVGSAVHLAFLFKNHNADEPSVTAGILGLITGAGFIVAGDASASQQKQDNSTPKIVDKADI